MKEIKKKAKFKTKYVEPVYPAVFRKRMTTWGWCPADPNVKIYSAYELWMPVMLMGWVQNEVHVQFSYQSLN